LQVKLKQEKRLNKIKRIYKTIARITGKGVSKTSSIHQIEEEESSNVMFDPD
jgi:hypothetical protein